MNLLSDHSTAVRGNITGYIKFALGRRIRREGLKQTLICSVNGNARVFYME